MKKIIISLVSVFIISASVVAANELHEKKTAVVREDFNLNLAGEHVKLTNSIVIIDGVSYLPVKEISTLLGNDVNFDNGVITITPKDTPLIEEEDLVTTVNDIPSTLPPVDPARIEKVKKNITDNIATYEQELLILNNKLADYESNGEAGKKEQVLKDIEVLEKAIDDSKLKLAELQK